MGPEWASFFFPVVLAAHGIQCLSSTEFKEKMSHIVNDLAGPARAVPRCVMDANQVKREPDNPNKVGLGTTSRNGLMMYIDRGE